MAEFDLAQIDFTKLDPMQQLRDLEKVECEESLYLFLRRGWRYIDPAPWQDGWPIEAIAEHLEAVVDGQIRNLIINVPPRCGKSSITSVAFPAWVWAQEIDSPTSGPGVPLLHASYASKLALRDSVKCRRLIQSKWYQENWGDRFRMTSDQNVKSRFTNDHGGERLITSVDAGVTGEGGNIIIIDDPNAANEAFSEATIQSTIEWWDQTISTRHNNPKAGAFIIIQQRLAENDLTGHVLDNSGEEWTHLCLPMRYERERSFQSSIGWEDPRSVENELMWPDRFDEAEVKKLERRLGNFGSAGQLQQRPEPKGGGIIKRAWWQPWEEKAYPPMDYIIGSLDTAFTEKTVNDPSALTIWGVFSSATTATPKRIIGSDYRPADYDRQFMETSPKVMLMHAWEERFELNPLVKEVYKTCKRMRVDLLIIESKASGISVAQEIRRIYQNEGMDFGVLLVNPGAQDKVARLFSVQHIFEEGLIHAPEKDWAEKVITQCGTFPGGTHDDLVDTTSQAIKYLRDNGLLTRARERQEELNQTKRYGGPAPPPLYPA